MQQCSASRNSPAKDVADAIQKREQAAIDYPPDNNFMGDWQKGERLAQSGYGLRFTDYPPRQANGGNCYACHQLTKKEVSYGTLGPEPARIRQAARLQAGGREGDLREDLQLARRASLLDHAALRHEQDPHRRADQGRGRAADEPGEPGEHGAVMRSFRGAHAAASLAMPGASGHPVDAGASGSMASIAALAFTGCAGLRGR